jgi:hypothetical protein
MRNFFVTTLEVLALMSFALMCVTPFVFGRRGILRARGFFATAVLLVVFAGSFWTAILLADQPSWESAVIGTICIIVVVAGLTVLSAVRYFGSRAILEKLGRLTRPRGEG